jgi:hypothetical protein
VRALPLRFPRDVQRKLPRPRDNRNFFRHEGQAGVANWVMALSTFFAQPRIQIFLDEDLLRRKIC